MRKKERFLKAQEWIVYNLSISVRKRSLRKDKNSQNSREKKKKKKKRKKLNAGEESQIEGGPKSISLL